MAGKYTEAQKRAIYKWRAKNRDKHNKASLEYYHKNREEINEKRRVKKSA